MKRIIYILVFCFSIISIAQNKSLFEKANDFYKNGKYNDAINTYNSILKTQEHSAELYFNLGNSHYKLNHIAHSIYNYEKALILNPTDKEIKQNLVFANTMKVDALEVLPEIGYTKYFNKFTSVLNTDTWAILSVIFVVLFAVLLISYYFTLSTKFKRIFFSSSFGFLLLALITLSFTYYKNNQETVTKPAIIFAKESKVKTEPNFKSQDAFILHEGTKVNVLDTEGNWNKIKLTNGKIGWILKDDIKLITIF
jgi:tetratricopeptide (TPR) repeat protein